MRRFLWAAAAFGLAACSSTPSKLPGGPDAGDVRPDQGTSAADAAPSGMDLDAGTISDDAGEGAESYTIDWGTVSVPPGVEHTKCVVKRLGNPSKLPVGAIHNQLGIASHHMIVYRVVDTVEQPAPFDCQPFKDTLDPTKGSPIMVSQKKDDLLTLPTGVAYTFDAMQMIRLELHYINATTHMIDAHASSTFIGIPAASYQHEADFLFIGNADINIPAMSATDLGPTYFQLPAVYAASNFFAITGHEHKLGKNVKISLATSKTATASDVPIYDVPNWLWSEPKTVVHDPPFVVPAGGGFRFTCSWSNTTTTSVHFGESANDEMCFFWAYYYPSIGAKVCVHTDRVPGGYDFCCPGDPACRFIP